MWSAGVVLYILLGGYPPFWSESEPLLFEQIRQGAFTYNDPVWKTVSSSAKDLIGKLLIVDPAKRLTASQALQHTWVAGKLGQQNTSPLLWTKKHHLSIKPRTKLRFRTVVTFVVASIRWQKLAISRSKSSGPAKHTIVSPEQVQVGVHE